MVLFAVLVYSYSLQTVRWSTNSGASSSLPHMYVLLRLLNIVVFRIRFLFSSTYLPVNVICICIFGFWHN